jgi:hypothetical protein
MRRRKFVAQSVARGIKGRGNRPVLKFSTNHFLAHFSAFSPHFSPILDRSCISTVQNYALQNYVLYAVLLVTMTLNLESQHLGVSYYELRVLRKYSYDEAR